MSLLSIARKEAAPMPFLFVRRQASHSEVSKTLAECFGIVFPHCLKAGLAGLFARRSGVRVCPSRLERLMLADSA
jgi:hypothetical protein